MIITKLNFCWYDQDLGPNKDIPNEIVLYFQPLASVLHSSKSIALSYIISCCSSLLNTNILLSSIPSFLFSSHFQLIIVTVICISLHSCFTTKK
ncbi:hypothetical protein RJT34_09280 [Clitoria ternatea]|uniref:Uncharacterized protein n=1 Tax=Clitoria ternatea TaxID=43366 RepID=A0AAN9K8N9_CLITE